MPDESRSCCLAPRAAEPARRVAVLAPTIYCPTERAPTCVARLVDGAGRGGVA